MAVSAASFHITLSSSQSFNPGSSVMFNENIFSPAGETDITLLPDNSTIVLKTGRYVVNYTVSIFNANETIKMALFVNGQFQDQGFSAGPTFDGDGHTSGDALFIVTAATATLELRVDTQGGPITPFSQVTMVITKLVESTS
ncbi:hypothetical protein [Paenibacillus albiflavus]|nr:hypothetical protein [Paenibacillus albiflavus]